MNHEQTQPTAREPPVVGQVFLIPTAEIFPMPDSPFQVRDDAAMEELAASIRQLGILNPVEVRPREAGGYEMLSGARRKHAGELAGLESIPAIILHLDDDDAILRMIDTNIQRENILPSERAKAYKMRMEAIKRKSGRPSLEVVENAPNHSAHFRSDDMLGEQVGVSGDTIRNYISLTQLIPELMQLVDEGTIALTPAYQIAGLPAESQQLLAQTIASEQSTPSVSQAKRMRELQKAGKLDEDTMLEIMTQQKKPVRQDITLSGEKLRKYFPQSYSLLQIEATIFKLLDAWHRKRQRDQSR